MKASSAASTLTFRLRTKPFTSQPNDKRKSGKKNKSKFPLQITAIIYHSQFIWIIRNRIKLSICKASKITGTGFGIGIVILILMNRGDFSWEILNGTWVNWIAFLFQGKSAFFLFLERAIFKYYRLHNLEGAEVWWKIICSFYSKKLLKHVKTFYVDSFEEFFIF